MRLAPSHVVGSLVVAACAASWGLVGIVVRDLQLPAPVIVCFRALFATAFVGLLAVIARKSWALRRPRLAVYGLGALLAVHFAFFFAAIHATSVASALLITYMAPVFMAALAPFLIGERVRRPTVAALALSVAGITVITLSDAQGPEDVRFIGVLLALAAGLTMALLITATKKFAHDIPPLQFIFHESLAAGLLFLPVALFSDYDLNSRALFDVALLGVVFTGMFGIVFIWALKQVPATHAGILSYLEPVSTAILADIFLGEALTGSIIIGGSLILAAGVIVVLAPPVPEALPIIEEIPGAGVITAGVKPQPMTVEQQHAAS